MLDLINGERAAIGLDPLTLELRLNDSAEDHSDWMLRTDTFSHTGAGGSNAGDRMRDAGFTFSGSWNWGENVAWQSERGATGLADDVRDLHNLLMNSPGHRANILKPEYEVIGIGIEYGNFNGWNAVMITQNFARTAAPVQLDELGNSAPSVHVKNVTLANLKGARTKKLENKMNVADDDGDSPVWYELLDTRGRDNFRFKGEGKIDASTPYRVDADDIDMIRIGANRGPSETKVKVRVFDGEDVSDWDAFVITTLSADDWLAQG